MNREFELKQVAEFEWELPKTGDMRVPGRIFAAEQIIAQLMEESATKTEWNELRQIKNVAALPGIVSASIAMPDLHPGYGFPIGGVGAFLCKEGVVAVGGIGFDINCGVRLLTTPLVRNELAGKEKRVADDLFRTVPAGLGSKGDFRLSPAEVDVLLCQGARFAVEKGYGTPVDLQFIEEEGMMAGADPAAVSIKAKQRVFRQMGTLGSGNHYLEIQYIEEIFDGKAAEIYGLYKDQVVVSIHTGSRALGHQIGQDYLKEMEQASRKYGIPIRERELVCAPIESSEGKRYISAVIGGINAAFANRQVLSHLVRLSLERTLGVAPTAVKLLYDVGHNTAKFESHRVKGELKELLVHRKGATRAFAAGHKENPRAYDAVGHPIIIGGTMGTASYIMRGTEKGMEKTFGSGIHGAGRAMSRKKAKKKYWGEDVRTALAKAGITLRAHSIPGVAEEAPGAYKDIDLVIAPVHHAGINLKVARLRPIVVIKG
ncbi:RtcB family protein [Candidatus Bipolaricaulota bacterium]|nr:RtcB family protein [Candidatus Bipolaricaulota bacterium]HBR09661.1 RNA-splicing ligase RtcB [Candidatus Acetothermia bacterium]